MAMGSLVSVSRTQQPLELEPKQSFLMDMNFSADLNLASQIAIVSGLGCHCLYYWLSDGVALSTKASAGLLAGILAPAKHCWLQLTSVWICCAIVSVWSLLSCSCRGPWSQLKEKKLPWDLLPSSCRWTIAVSSSKVRVWGTMSAKLLHICNSKASYIRPGNSHSGQFGLARVRIWQKVPSLKNSDTPELSNFRCAYLNWSKKQCCSSTLCRAGCKTCIISCLPGMNIKCVFHKWLT